MKQVTWEQFDAVELRVGTIVAVEDFPQARVPAYKITVDFGPDIGVKKTSARVTDLYSKNELLDRQCLGVVNFAAKQIGPIRSEFLLTGFQREDGAVVLAIPERLVPDGAKLA